jgi:hypothetical protein
LTIFFSAHESGTCFTHTAIFIRQMLLVSRIFNNPKLASAAANQTTLKQ